MAFPFTSKEFEYYSKRERDNEGKRRSTRVSDLVAKCADNVIGFLGKIINILV
jgi:hypothetical protein